MDSNLNILTIDLFTEMLKDVWLHEVYSRLECIPEITRYQNSDDDLYMSFEFVTINDIPNQSIVELNKNPFFIDKLHDFSDAIEMITGLTFLDLTDIKINRLPNPYGVEVNFTYYLTKDKLEIIKLLYKIKRYDTENVSYISSMFTSCTTLKNISFPSLKNI